MLTNLEKLSTGMFNSSADTGSSKLHVNNLRYQYFRHCTGLAMVFKRLEEPSKVMISVVKSIFQNQIFVVFVQN